MPKSIDQLRSTGNQRVQYKGAVVESGLRRAPRSRMARTMSTPTSTSKQPQQPNISDRTMLPRDTRDDYGERETAIDLDIMRQLDNNPYVVRAMV